MSEFLEFIQTVGFPAFIAVYLLIQSNKQEEAQQRQQEEMRKAIERNTEAVNDLKDYISRSV